MELTTTARKDFDIGIKICNPSPGFEIITKFNVRDEIGHLDTNHHFLHYFYEGELSINDILGLILYYLKYGNDKLLVNKDIGLYVTKFLEEHDLIHDDVVCEIEDVFVYYVDRFYCKHLVEFPNNIDIDTVIKEIKKYCHESNRRTME